MAKQQDTFKKGSVEMLLLYLLQEGDLYGYQISQYIKERSEGILVVPEGSLYPALYRMLDKGYISDEKRQVGKRLTRVYYHLEPAGKVYLDTLLESYMRTDKGIRLVLGSIPPNLFPDNG